MREPQSDPEAQRPRILPTRTITLEVTEQPRHTHASGEGVGFRLTRTLSRHDTIPPSSRLPIEYRTLSLQVDQHATIDKTADAKAPKGAVKELSALDWHKISVDEALRRLAVAPKTGLDPAQAQRRTQTYGKNQISPPPSRTLRKVFGWFFGGFGSLLLIAGIVSFICWKPLGNPPLTSTLSLAVVLIIVVVLQAIFNAWQDFSTSRVMASIKGMLPAAVLVLRDGVQTNIPAVDLVPGDLVYIVMGQKVPADLKLVEVTNDLKFDRSVLTGESEPIAGRIDKTDDNILEGTLCVNGSGMGLVIQIGDNTVFGRIAKLSSEAPTELTTMQREILRFIIIVGSLAILVAIFIVIVWSAWLRVKFPDFINVPTMLLDVVSVLVAFIPEGLPISVTISLAKVAHTLSKHKVLCKSLSIVETLGSVNVLCSDKTGTLTQNKMHVEDAAVFDASFSPKSLREQIESTPSTVSENLRQLPAISCICNAATFHAATPEKEEHVIGDATDSAIMLFAHSFPFANATRSRWQHIHKMNFNSKTKYMLTLSKLMPTTDASEGLVAPLASWDSYQEEDLLLCVKGAPEVLMPRCTRVINPAGGEPLSLSFTVKQRIIATQEKWAAQGRRVLVIARRVVPHNLIPKDMDRQSDEFEALIEELNSHLIIVGLVGLIDPLKPDIAETVRICRGAGIRFFVVTGDHPATSVAIAGQAGIISNPATVHHFSDLPSADEDKAPVPEETEKRASESDRSSIPGDLQSIVITGAELDKVTPAQMDVLYAYQEIVFARTTPEQKLRIVQALQARDSIVAMTGDGVNDAPSLRAADCGIAMGSGSDVAREAADMVLLEDFSAIVVALEYGRLVFDNLKKTILYLLPAGSFSELMPLLLNVLIGVPQMLSNIQMIIICIITDVLPALSMCFEPPESGLLSRPPRNTKTERLADWRLLLHAYWFLGAIETICAFSMSFWFLQRRGVPFSSLALGFGNWPGLTNDLLLEAQGVYFFTLVIMQWGNLLATRLRKSSIVQQPPSWHINRCAIPAAILALSFGIFFSYVPAFNDVLETHPIPVEYFFLPMAFGLGLLMSVSPVVLSGQDLTLLPSRLDEVRKLLVRQNPTGILAKMAW
ncbi:sodium-potassium ATPase [Artomyces pyxidatus]|uniref:Sodium-potassium ATPase n=1 Tax=Artomyces pyxidatus TaxID=48021 RepID=A0ACB8T9Q6_9AGAM|nr:sodium-potassium ATPase [Artomyces pyxidatus]